MWQCNAEERLGKWTFWIIFHEFWCTLFFVSLTAFYSRYLSIQWLICNVDPFGTNAHVHIWAVFGLLLHQEGPYESDFCKVPFKNGIDAKTECVFFAFLKFVKFWNILHDKEWDLSRKKKKHVSVTWGWWAHMTPIPFVTAFLHLPFLFRSLNLSFFYHCIASLM